MQTRFPLLVAGLAAVAGCQERVDPAVQARNDSIARVRAESIALARQDSINRAQPGYIIDSILPVEEELRRFRADIATRPTALSDGADSRDALVSRFIHGLEANDTTTLVKLLLNRAEFAYLVYPESPWTHPPYRQSPQLVWMQASRVSGTGLTRAIRRYTGRSLGYDTYECSAEPEILGKNRIWRNCMLHVLGPDGARVSIRLFAGIIERDGHFKIYSYGNDL